MPTLPVDIVNRALDECGLEPIGDLASGERVAGAARRIYWSTVKQLLSAAHWNFARKQDSMTLLADASGQNQVTTDVPTPWSYMYEWPTDCVHARFVPRTGTWNSPSPFLVSSANRPNPIESNWFDVEGHDPEQTKVILSNQFGAQLIYTGLMQYPDAWDPLFEQAVVAGLAARLAMPLIPDKKEARVIRMDNISIARAALDAARVRDGDEGWTVQDHTPDWIRARANGFVGGTVGMLFCPWNRISWIEDAGGIY